MYIPIILAHGALGEWDEIIFLSVAAIFVAMMGISWVRSRNAAPPTDTPQPPETPESKAEPTPETDGDRFRLE